MKKLKNGKWMEKLEMSKLDKRTRWIVYGDTREEVESRIGLLVLVMVAGAMEGMETKEGGKADVKITIANPRKTNADEVIEATGDEIHQVAQEALEKLREALGKGGTI